MTFSKTLRSYLISYLIIFCIPTVALISFCYTQFLRQFQQMTTDMELAEQQKRGELIDTTFEQIKTASMQFGLQYQVTATDLEEDVNVRQRLLSQLQNLQLLLSPYVEEALLWIPGQEYLYSNNSTYSLESYDTIHRVDLSPALADTVRGLPPSGTQLISLSGPGAQGALYFICSYPYQSFSPQGQLVLRIDADAFTSMAGREYALLYQDQLLLNLTGLEESGLAPGAWAGSGELLVSGETGNRFRLLTVPNDEELFAALGRTKRIFIMLVAAVSVLSAVCLCAFSYRNYKPINQLDQALSRLGVVERGSGGNHSEVTRAIASMEQLDRRLLEERSVTRGLWISRLVNSQGENTGRVLEELEAYGVELQAAEYAVAILQVDRQVQANQYFDDVVFLRQGRDQVYYYIDARGQIVLLAAGEPGLEERLPGLLQEIQEKLEGVGIRCAVFAGGAYPELEKLYNSYVDALLLTTDESRVSEGLHLSWAGNPARHFLYPSLELKSLATALENRETGEVRSLLQILSSQMEQSIYKDFLCKTICYEVANIVLRTLEPGDGHGELRSIAGRFIMGLNSSHSGGELRAQLQGLEDSLCQVLQPADTGEQPAMPETFVESILAYIHDNYADPGFYLGQVAERFHISQNNLSQQLKRTLGISPVKYITALRIEAAKALLVGTEDSVKQIAGQVGFGDDSSFIRKFKSITSVTPNQYRALHRPDRQA